MTKKLYIYLILTSIFFVLTAFQCEEEVACSTTKSYTTEKTPIKVKKPTNLKINDTLWISLSVNENLKDINGNNIILKIDDVEELSHYFQTELKNNFNEFNELNFGVFYVDRTGKLNTFRGGVTSGFVFDDTLKSYNYNFGLILKEKGTYKITSSNLFFNDYGGDCPDFFYEIPVFFENADLENNQIYTFTVD
ncbi:hypothetical protein [Polaribacter sp. R77954]|uniref:hypothetical protein n=1 Tax=Polaribacter sp. R77954 TaxID=3093870 RepID=UPI0037C95DEE